MFRKSLAGTFLIFLMTSLSGQELHKSEQKLSLLFIGDIMGHDTQIWAAENTATNTYNYAEVFSYIKPIITEADVAIANFEVTLAGQPYKGYPQFSSPAAYAVACRNAGIDYLVTANNHAADRGKNGIIGTINRLDSIGMPHTGTFIDKNARENLQPLIIRKNGISVALLNYTYGTNGINVPEPVIVNKLDKESISSDITKTKNLNPDVVVLFLHWGTEYDTIPSQSQVDLADYFFSLGVDLIIGSHPHVLQKMIWYKEKNKAVVYSLGNFVSNQRKPRTDGGSMVRIELIKNDNTVSISDAGYYLTWVYTPILKYTLKFFILPCSEFENKPDFFTNPADYAQMKTFITRSRKFLNEQNINFREYALIGNSRLLNK